jgi:FkbM family methyltransferase
MLKRIYWNLPSQIFVYVFNFRRFYLKSKIRISKEDSKIFKITDSDCNFSWYCHRNRLTLYSHGLMFRANQIADAYGLKDLEFFDQDIIIDCGANMGDLQLYFHLKQIRINYIAFEPSKLEYTCLSKNILFPGKIYQIALSDSNSEIDLFVDTAGANSSIIEPPFFTEVVRVKSARLDSIIYEKSIALFKVEAEGAEPEVLHGITKIVNQFKYICVDAGPERGILQETTLKDVRNFCTDNHFKEIGNKFNYRLVFKNEKYI